MGKARSREIAEQCISGGVNETGGGGGVFAFRIAPADSREFPIRPGRRDDRLVTDFHSSFGRFFLDDVFLGSLRLVDQQD